MIHNRPDRVHPANRFAPPGFLLPVSAEEDVLRMDNTLAALWTGIQQMKSDADASVVRAQRSNYLSPVVHLTPGMPWVLGFGTKLVSTINHWDDPDFDRAASILTLTCMIVTLAYVVFMYHRYHRQVGMIQHRTQHNKDLQEIQDSLAYLQEANKTAKACLNPEYQDNLPVLYKTFNKYIKHMQFQSPESIPPALAVSWAQVREIIRSSPDDPRRAEIAALVREQIFPMINHYIQSLQQRLKELGYTPQIEIPEILPVPYVQPQAGPHPAAMSEVTIED